jgi:hypothetical protein
VRSSDALEEPRERAPGRRRDAACVVALVDAHAGGLVREDQMEAAVHRNVLSGERLYRDVVPSYG